MARVQLKHREYAQVCAFHESPALIRMSSDEAPSSPFRPSARLEASSHSPLFREKGVRRGVLNRGELAQPSRPSDESEPLQHCFESAL